MSPQRERVGWNARIANGIIRWSGWKSIQLLTRSDGRGGFRPCSLA